jgi:hypothetical protein
MNSENPLEGDPDPASRLDEQDLEQGPAWDADDPRRKKDCFAPPTEPCECICMHCHRTFMSDQMWFQQVINGRDGFQGFWMCPTANCSGAGFTFDIFPTDPAHPANDGWFEVEEPRDVRDWNPEDDEEEFDQEADLNEEWDPEELQYKALDDDDIEGEEWKQGAEPELTSCIDPNAEIPGFDQDEEEALYNQPDQRPRVVDWNEREHRDPPMSGGAHMGDDDIPF